MRKLLLAIPVFLIALALGCQSKTPVGPGVVKITETTTSTSTTTTTTTTILIPTVASFVFSPLTPEVNQVVTFNAAGSTPGTGRTLVRYTWDFGDGGGAEGIRVTHAFAPSGVYLVTVKVTDDQGKPTEASQTITVRPVIP